MAKARGIEALLTLPNVHLKNGQPYVRISYRDGSKWRSKEKRVRDLDEALRVLRELKAEYGLLGPAAFDGERMTFAELLKQYRCAHPNKPPWYLAPLAEYFGQRRIRQITYGDLKRFKEAREAVPKREQKKREGAAPQPRQPATINRELEQLRAVLLYALGHGWLKINPFKAGPPLIIKNEEEPRDRVPTPEEEARILAACVPPREHLKGLIITTADTGLRRSALLVLVWELVNWEQRLLGVPRAPSRYKRRPKQIGMTERLWNELRRIWEQAGCPAEGRIFPVKTEFKRSYKTACRIAGVEGLRFNDFRHKFATDLMEANVPKRLAMKVAGHANAATHDIYANVDERLALQVAAALDRLHAARQSGGNIWADGLPWPLASDAPQ